MAHTCLTLRSTCAVVAPSNCNSTRKAHKCAVRANQVRLQQVRLAAGARRGQHQELQYSTRRVAPCASGKGFQSPQEELKRTAEIDALIDAMLALPVDERRLKVTENLMEFGTDFYLRCASRSDAAASEDDKQNIMQLATDCMNITAADIREAEKKKASSEQVLRGILTAAADPDTGEFEVPLGPAAISRMYDLMLENKESCGEEMRSYAFAYMRKINEDSENEVEGMSLIIQKVLQLFCKLTLAPATEDDSADQKPEEQIIDNVLRNDVSLWQQELQKHQVWYREMHVYMMRVKTKTLFYILE